MMTPTIAPGYRRLRILKPIEYARETLPPGRVVVVDETTASQWIVESRAEAVAEAPPGPQLWPTCPRCGAQFAIPETVEAGAPRWVQCPRCPHGWTR